jgi:hypothetical protein
MLPRPPSLPMQQPRQSRPKEPRRPLPPPRLRPHRHPRLPNNLDIISTTLKKPGSARLFCWENRIGGDKAAHGGFHGRQII